MMLHALFKVSVNLDTFPGQVFFKKNIKMYSWKVARFVNGA